MSTEVARREGVGIEVYQGWTPVALRAQIEREKELRTIIVEYFQSCMVEGHHYYRLDDDDKKKPALSKEGALNLCNLFRVRADPDPPNERWSTDGHYTVRYRTRLVSLETGDLMAIGDGLCSTRESKYAYRYAARVCPECGKAAIIKGREEYGGGWLCLLPETPILYADFTWRPVGAAKPGDVVFGFDEYPTSRKFGRKLRPSVIEHVWSSRQQTKRLITTGADITTTAGHQWLQHHAKPGHIGGWHDPWGATDRLRVGNYLRDIGVQNPPPVTDDYRAGYIAGITLGDGTNFYVSGQKATPKRPFWWRVALKASDEVALGRIVAYLTHFGVEAYIRPFDSGVEYDGVPYDMKKVEIRSIARLEAIQTMMHERDTLEYQRGFIAGFFDAEGTGGDHQRVYQKDHAVLYRMRRYASNLGFTFTVHEREDSRSSATLMGGIMERARFFSTCQPALLRKAGLYGITMQYNPAQIVAIEPGAVRDVMDIQTSTGTFFAAGLATHNCFKRKEGCGTKFREGDPVIESQVTGRVPNEDIADQENTVLKMSEKRSLVDGALKLPLASELFIQDLEEQIIQRQQESQERAGGEEGSRRAGKIIPDRDKAKSQTVETQDLPKPTGPEVTQLLEFMTEVYREERVKDQYIRTVMQIPEGQPYTAARLKLTMTRSQYNRLKADTEQYVREQLVDRDESVDDVPDFGAPVASPPSPQDDARPSGEGPDSLSETEPPSAAEQTGPDEGSGQAEHPPYATAKQIDTLKKLAQQVGEAAVVDVQDVLDDHGGRLTRELYQTVRNRLIEREAAEKHVAPAAGQD